MFINDNAVINNNCGGLQDVILLFKIVPWAHKRISLKLMDNFGTLPRKVSPVVIYSIAFLCCLPFWVTGVRIYEVNCGFFFREIFKEVVTTEKEIARKKAEEIARKKEEERQKLLDARCAEVCVMKCAEVCVMNSADVQRCVMNSAEVEVCNE